MSNNSNPKRLKKHPPSSSTGKQTNFKKQNHTGYNQLRCMDDTTKRLLLLLLPRFRSNTPRFGLPTLIAFQKGGIKDYRLPNQHYRLPILKLQIFIILIIFEECRKTTSQKQNTTDHAIIIYTIRNRRTTP